MPLGNRYWVNGRYIDAEGNILGDNILVKTFCAFKEVLSGTADDQAIFDALMEIAETFY